MKYLGWTSKTNNPQWHSGVFFAVAYEVASSRRKGLSFSLYNDKGCFGCKKLVAKHEFDPGRITFYEPFGPDWIELTTPGKKPASYGRLQVKVQYVRGSDYFTCPTCSRLTDHTPIFLLGNMSSVTLAKESQMKKGVKMMALCNKEKETTPVDKKGVFNYHFLWDYKNIASGKKVVFKVFKKNSVVGSVVIPLDDLLEGNLCELTKPVLKGKKEVGKAVILLQTIYECSECIVEREDEDGAIDIPAKKVVKKEPQRADAVQLVGTIPGMTPAAPATTATLAAPATPAVPVAPVAPVAQSAIPTAIPVTHVAMPPSGAVAVNSVYSYPVATPAVTPVQVTPVAPVMQVPQMGGVFPSTVTVGVQNIPGMNGY